MIVVLYTLKRSAFTDRTGVLFEYMIDPQSVGTKVFDDACSSVCLAPVTLCALYKLITIAGEVQHWDERIRKYKNE